VSSRFRQTSLRTDYEGRFVIVRVGTYRHEDGEEVTREWVDHPGAVAIVAHDDEQLYLVRQPREAVGESDLLELPAGKLDVKDAEPLATAQRELAEEIGKAAEHWEPLKTFYTSAGFSNERITVFLATGLSDRPDEMRDDERIDVVVAPLGALDDLIAETEDAKTLIGLLAFRARRQQG
jgi:8-oxo-dGTP pyrophosphatase MutT (NUDIX family)